MSTDETDDVTLMKIAFGAALRVEMARAGLDQKALAGKSDLSEGTIRNYFHARQTPRIPELRRLSQALGIPVNTFLDRIIAEEARVEAEARAGAAS